MTKHDTTGSGADDRPALEKIETVAAALGPERFRAAVKLVTDWEDSTDLASSLVSDLYYALRPDTSV